MVGIFLKRRTKVLSEQMNSSQSSAQSISSQTAALVSWPRCMPGILSKIDVYPKMMSSISKYGEEFRQKSVNKELLIFRMLLMMKTSFLHFRYSVIKFPRSNIQGQNCNLHERSSLYWFRPLQNYGLRFFQVMLSFQLLWTRVSHRTSASRWQEMFLMWLKGLSLQVRY